jgi:hypothetical protein
VERGIPSGYKNPLLALISSLNLHVHIEGVGIKRCLARARTGSAK